MSATSWRSGSFSIRDSTMFISSANISTGSNRDAGWHISGSKPSFSVAVFDRPNLLDLQLRPVVRLPQHGPHLVKLPGRPLGAARLGERRIGPDRKANFAPRVAKRHAVVRLAVARLQFLLFREQRKKIASWPSQSSHSGTVRAGIVSDSPLDMRNDQILQNEHYSSDSMF